MVAPTTCRIFEHSSGLVCARRGDGARLSAWLTALNKLDAQTEFPDG